MEKLLTDMKRKQERLGQLLGEPRSYVTASQNEKERELAKEINYMISIENVIRAALGNGFETKVASSRPATPHSLCEDERVVAEEITEAMSHFEGQCTGTDVSVKAEDMDSTFYKPAEAGKAVQQGNDSSMTFYEPAERSREETIELLPTVVEKAPTPRVAECSPVSPNYHGCPHTVCECQGPVRGRKRKQLQGRPSTSFGEFCKMAGIDDGEAVKLTKRRFNHERPKSPIDYWNPELPAVKVMLQRQLAPLSDEED